MKFVKSKEKMKVKFFLLLFVLASGNSSILPVWVLDGNEYSQVYSRFFQVTLVIFIK